MVLVYNQQQPQQQQQQQQQQQNLNTNSGPIQDSGQQNLNTNSGPIQSSGQQNFNTFSDSTSVDRPINSPDLNNQQSNNTNPNTLSENILQYQGNNTAKYILLLDIKQICLIAGNFNCVAQQNQFATSSLTTTHNSINNIWAISGTVKDASKSLLNNTQVTAIFYDGKGNPISINPTTTSVTPNTINPFEDGSFAFNVSVNNDLNGINPLYMVLVYNQQNNNNNNRILIPIVVQSKALANNRILIPIVVKHHFNLLHNLK